MTTTYVGGPIKSLIVNNLQKSASRFPPASPVPTFRIVDNYTQKFRLRVSNDVLSLVMVNDMKIQTEKETSQEKAIKLVERSMTKWERRRKRWQAFKVQNNIWQPLKIC